MDLVRNDPSPRTQPADDELFEITVESSPPTPVLAIPEPVPFIPLVAPLKTARLIMRPYVEADLVQIHRIYGDPDVMRSTGAVAAQTVDELKTHLARRIGHQERHGFSAWAVFERDTEELVGDAGLVELEGTTEVELSYRFRRDTWGRGYAAEVASAWVELAFRTMGLPALRANVPKDNRAAARVLENLGMRKISETRTLLSYAISREDYEA